jgi:hypothetical protein
MNRTTVFGSTKHPTNAHSEITLRTREYVPNSGVESMSASKPLVTSPITSSPSLSPKTQLLPRSRRFSNKEPPKYLVPIDLRNTLWTCPSLPPRCCLKPLSVVRSLLFCVSDHT